MEYDSKGRYVPGHARLERAINIGAALIWAVVIVWGLIDPVRIPEACLGGMRWLNC